jgi:tryptophan 2,3-dioxygenase
MKLSMTKDDAIRMIEIIGGTRKAASMIKNRNGQPMAHPNLSKAVNGEAEDIIAEWLAQQLLDVANEKIAEDSAYIFARWSAVVDAQIEERESQQPLDPLDY